MQEKVESTIKKLSLWTFLIDKCKYDQFPNFKLFLDTTSSTVNEDLKSDINADINRIKYAVTSQKYRRNGTGSNETLSDAEGPASKRLCPLGHARARVRRQLQAIFGLIPKAGGRTPTLHAPTTENLGHLNGAESKLIFIVLHHVLLLK